MIGNKTKKIFKSFTAIALAIILPFSCAFVLPVQTKAATTSSQTTATTKQVKITGSSVNVRKGAGTNYGIITSVKKNKVYTYTATKKVGSVTWYKITVNSKTSGWISGKYAKIVTTTTTKVSTTTTSQTTTNVTTTTKPTTSANDSSSPANTNQATDKVTMLRVQGTNAKVYDNTGKGAKIIADADFGSVYTFTEKKTVGGTTYFRINYSETVTGWIKDFYVRDVEYTIKSDTSGIKSYAKLVPYGSCVGYLYEDVFGTDESVPIGSTYPILYTIVNKEGKTYYAVEKTDGSVRYVLPEDCSLVYDGSRRFVKSSVNFRKGPGTKYGIIKELPVNTIVYVQSTNNGWSKVIYNGTVGYISANYLSTNAIKKNAFSTSGSISSSNKSNTNTYLNKIPTNVWNAFVSDGWKMLVTTKKVTSDYTLTNAGVMLSANKIVAIRYNAASYALIHEIGHYIDYRLGLVSYEDEFEAIFNTEAKKAKFKGTLSSKHYTDSREYFADSFQQYFNYKSNLKKQAPKTYAFIEKCIKKIK